MKAWIKNNLGVILIIALTAFIYQNSFFSPFFQDDKILLEISKSGDILRIIPNFPYRPLSLQTFYFLSYKFFALNVFFYHLVLFAFFSATLIVINNLALVLLKSKRKALLTTFFYALNVSIFPLFYWVATSYFSIGAFFYFLTLLLYLKKPNLSIITFVLALACNEIAFTLPFVLIFLSWHQKIWHKSLLILFITGAALLLLRILAIGFPKSDAYKMHFDLQVIGTIRWYILRALNLPEGIRGTASLAFFMGLVSFICLFLVSLTKRPNFRLVIFGGAVFFLGALPFFFLPGHMSSYYLTISLFGGSLILAEVLSKKLMLPAIIIYILLTLFGLSYLSLTHWIILKNTGPIGQFTTL